MGELDRWVRNGFVKEMSQEEFRLSKFTPTAFVHHNSRQNRIVVDLWPLNEQFSDLSAAMEGFRVLSTLIQKDIDLLSWDWPDEHHQFRIHRYDRHQFHFSIAGSFFDSITLPFRWNQSPWIFTKAMRPFLESLRSIEFKFLGYLDDFSLRPRPEPGLPISLRDCRSAIAVLEPLFPRL